MKKSCIIGTIFLLSAISAFAQQRPRHFDNFDRLGGVQIQSVSPTAVAADKNTGSRSTNRNVPQHYLPSPSAGAYDAPSERTANTKLVKKTAQATMTVYDGFAQREASQSAPGPQMTMAAGKHMGGFSTGNPLHDSYIVDSSRRYKIDPLLIYAQMGQESSFKQRALSNKGASGLMQLMPATARRLGVTNIYDPKQNIEGGVKYMRMLLDMFGQNMTLALAGYNAGEGAVMKYGNQIPPYNETQDYVRRISARYATISLQGTARGSKPTTAGQSQSFRDDRYEPAVVTTRAADGRQRLVNR